jgi:hypothetical protein
MRIRNNPSLENAGLESISTCGMLPPRDDS